MVATPHAAVTPPWSRLQRVAFRFLFATMLVLAFPFPLGFIPGTGRLAQAVTEPWQWAVAWFAEHVLRIEPPPFVVTGSGDTLWHWVWFLLVLTLAAVITIVWSILDRRRAYPRLASALHVGARYFLASIMLGYGLAKVIPVQFGTVWLPRYDVRLGDMSPMGLLWTFMAHSAPYTIAAGIAEVVGAVLLLSRRTTIFGALILIVVMTNVVLLNLCYDVPVKLFSMSLLAIAIGIALPSARRLIGAALGHAAPAVAPRPRGSLGAERVRMLAKLVILVSFVISAHQWRQLATMIHHPPTVLHGSWRIDRHSVDGIELPSDFTHDERWRTLHVHERGITVRHATDRRSHLRAEVDPEAKTLTILDGIIRYPLAYRRTGDALVLDGTLRGERLHLELVLMPPAELSTRGFHWVTEEPYYR